jgi:hypothetical protein
MDTLWIISGAVVVFIAATLFKSRRSARMNLGSVSRDWVIRHSSD